MIAIINESGFGNDVCKYRLQINKKLIVKFTHKRADGLAVCLYKAAKAAEIAKMETIVKKY